MQTTEEKKKRKPQRLPKILSKEDVQKLLDSFNCRYPTQLRNRAIVQVFYRCGLRNSELCNLALDDVKIDGPEDGFIYVQLGKNSKDRFVPLDAETIAWLQKWEAIRPESDWYFCTLKGGQISPHYIRDVFERKSKKMGIYIQDGRKKKHPHPHIMRHTCATEMLEDGLTIREVQEILGHKHIQTTGRYLSVRPQALAEKIKQRGRMRQCQSSTV